MTEGLERKSRWGAILACAVITLLATTAGLAADPASDTTEQSAALAQRAAAWLDGLDEGQRRTARYDFEDDERFDLRLAPILLEGLRRDRLSEEQWTGLLSVLGAVLSPEGLAKVETIMSLEREVRLRDQESLLFGWFGRFVHGEQRYYTAIFGEPGMDSPWGLRFDGHHISLNWTSVPPGALSVTPIFLGAEPREVSAGWEREGLRALAEEEDRARALWNALDTPQQLRASLPLEIASGPAGGSRPLFIGEGERISPADPVGLARDDMTAEQAALLDDLIEVYLGNFSAPIAAGRREAIDAAGRGAVRYAQAGDGTPGEPAYYRVQGPTFLIEYDDTVLEADHLHTVWREFDGDFGRDLLAEHHARHHVPALALARD